MVFRMIPPRTILKCHAARPGGAVPEFKVNRSTHVLLEGAALQVHDLLVCVMCVQHVDDVQARGLVAQHHCVIAAVALVSVVQLIQQLQAPPQ
jgi:hypothetical protein